MSSISCRFHTRPSELVPFPHSSLVSRLQCRSQGERIALSWRGLNPIKPVYDPGRPDGRLDLTASAFSQLSQYIQQSWSQGLLRRTRRFLPLTVVVTIASTHCACPRKDGQAELAWVDSYVMRQFTCSKAVTHPRTNRAHCRATALIETSRYTKPLQVGKIIVKCVYAGRSGRGRVLNRVHGEWTRGLTL